MRSRKGPQFVAYLAIDLILLLLGKDVVNKQRLVSGLHLLIG
jgi:hypothetical protein